MNLLDAKTLATNLMHKHGLITKGWTFKFDNAKRRFGQCHYTYKHISLSKTLVSLNDEARVKNTILHEIAHALVGSNHGHDRVWVACAKSIGCDGNRCYSATNVETPKGNYQAICPSCGHKHYKFKRRRTSRQTSCGVCSSSYNPKALLIYEPVR